MIKIKKPGLFTTVQDLGRFGFYDQGLAPSGALDPNSYRIANALVGNQQGAAVLEMAYIGPEIEFTENAVIAVTGANMVPKVNGQTKNLWETIALKAGDVLSFKNIAGGARAYLAVKGGIDVPLVMGSYSTYTPSGIGGYKGRALKAGDELNIGKLSEKDVKIGTNVSEKISLNLGHHFDLRIVGGLCDYRLSEKGKHTLSHADFTITSMANRVGYRIKLTEPIDLIEREQPFGAGSSQTNVVEVGYPIGSLHLSGQTQPIILLNDAVTVGGYATIATIISCDLNLIAQAGPGDVLNFHYVTVDEAMEARRANATYVQNIIASIS